MESRLPIGRLMVAGRLISLIFLVLSGCHLEPIDRSCASDSDCPEGWRCQFSGRCVSVEDICLDGIDNDSDGLIDCQDDDCAEGPDCYVPLTDGGSGPDSSDDALGGDLPLDVQAGGDIQGEATVDLPRADSWALPDFLDETDVSSVEACLDDEWEENDTLATARQVYFDNVEPKVYGDLLSCPEDNDFYKVTLPCGSGSCCLYVTVSSSAPESLFDLLIYGGNDVIMSLSSWVGSFTISQQVSFMDYYIQIEAVEPPPGGTPYEISLMLLPSLCP